MTRINLVPPQELTDQHLFAEFREIKMVPKALARSIKAKGLQKVISSIPTNFTLNTGHVYFFYNKGKYLHTRYQSLYLELEARNYQFNRNSLFDPEYIYTQYPELFQDYIPTPEALALIRARIAHRISMKPNWYRKTIPQ